MDFPAADRGDGPFYILSLLARAQHGSRQKVLAVDDRRKRLLYRSQHRGMREVDILLGRFAAYQLPAMSLSDLDTFEALMEENDHDILNWVLGRDPIPARHVSPLMMLLLEFNNTT